MRMRASIGCTLRKRRSTLGRGWSSFAIERSHACSVRDCPASWSPPSGGAERMAYSSRTKVLLAHQDAFLAAGIAATLSVDDEFEVMRADSDAESDTPGSRFLCAFA